MLTETKSGAEPAGLGGEGESRSSALLRRADERPLPEERKKLRIERIAALPVQLDVRVPVPDFRVSDLLALAPGKAVASLWPSGDDVPLFSGDVQLVWTEFEVVDQTLAVRVTRLV